MGHYRRVLLTEDDPLVLLTLTLAFQAEELEVLGAGSAREAMQALRDTMAGIQAAVIDLDLKGGDGYAVARACRALNPEMAVVYLSATARPEFATSAVADGELTKKPVVPQALAKHVRARLDRGVRSED
jgi:two-component system OmpR family response regulator